MSLSNKPIFLYTSSIKNIFKNTFVCLIVFSLSGCGTINTVVKGDSAAQYNLSQVKSPCETIPRIYSGVSYDICALRGKPPRTALWLGSAPELVLIDLALSGVFDTVFLPYTIYAQMSEGSILLKY